MPDPTPEERAAAQAFARTNTSLDLGQLKTALQGAYGDAWSVGALTGAQSTGATLVAGLDGVSAPENWDAYWDAWEPGNAAAAVKLDAGGLADLLAQSGAAIDGIEGTTLDQFGSILASGVLDGLSIDDIAGQLGDYLDDPDRAYQIADTEVARATEAASQDAYSAAGVTQVDWLDSPDACDECVDLADASPYDIDDFPDLPDHPSCRCSSSPVDPGSGDDTGDDSGE